MPGQTNATMIINSGGLTSGDYKVKFIDVDGTVLKEEWVMSGGNATPPANPSYDSSYLTFSYWNETYTNVTKNINVGAIYTTLNNRSYIFITLTPVTGLVSTINLKHVSTAYLTFNWGDGNTTTTSQYGGTTTSYTYATYGNYVITIYPTSGVPALGLGGGATTTSFFGANTQVYRDAVKKIYGGINLSYINNYGLYQHRNLEVLVLVNPTGITNATYISDYGLQTCQSLKCVNFPSTLNALGTACFIYCSSLRYTTMAGYYLLGGYNYQFCESMNDLDLIIGKANSTTLLTYIMGDTYITKLDIPNNITTISANAFQNCVSLKGVTFSTGTTTISANSFLNDSQVIKYVLNKTTPPTLSNVNAFTGISSICKIYVPQSATASYRIATNWSTYANYIYSIDEM